MSQILCSTGALLGRPNHRDYRLLGNLASKLECDGFEFMMYESWYSELENLISSVQSFHLNIPVIHAQKSLGEYLCGMKVWHEGDEYPEYVMTEKEDKAWFQKGIELFSINLKIANAFGAEKMVLHLWNGLPSDKNMDKNVERFGILKDMAKKAGVTLMVENVICNTNSPLYNMKKVHHVYPDADFVYDTKMAEFHGETMKLFEPKWEWLVKEGHLKHLHINDYGGGYMDWGNYNILPIGKGHIDFDRFLRNLFQYGYDGDYTVEATAFDRTTGNVDIEMLNTCFKKLRMLIKKWRIQND